jgi:hypothetical protein
VSTDSNYNETVMKADCGENNWLEIRGDGMVVTCSETKSGHRCILMQSWPKLLPWLAQRSNGRLIEIPIVSQGLPDTIAAQHSIPSVFAIFPDGNYEFPILITREPLSAKKLKRLLSELPPITAILNNGRIHVPVGSADLAEGL